MNALYVKFLEFFRDIIMFGLWKSPWPIRQALWRYSSLLHRFFHQDIELITYYDENIRIKCNLNNFLELQLFFQGMQRGDLGVYFYIKQNLNKEKIFLDIGAGVGTFTLVAAKRAKKVMAFEPLPIHYNRLLENIELNNFKNIEVYNVALGNYCGKAEICIPDNINTGMAYIKQDDNEKTGNVYSVEITALDSFVNYKQVERIDIIKIDVEGFELNILEGGKESIKGFKPDIIMEVNINHLKRSGKSLKDLFLITKDLRYNIFILNHNFKDKYFLEEVNNINDLKGHQNVVLKPL